MLDNTKIHEIIVIIPNWLGDVAMCTPALRALRRQFPQSRITVLGGAAPCALLHGFPGIDQHIPIPGKLGIKDMLALRNSLGIRPDLALIFPHSFRAALLCKMLGAKNRLGYKRGGRSWLLTQAIAPYRENGKITPVYMAKEYLDLIAPLGCQDDDAGLSLALDPETQAAIENELPTNRPLVAIAPGAAFGSSKRWLPERYAQVADMLHASHGAACVLLTGPGEEDTRDAVLAAAKTTITVCDAVTPSVERLKAQIAVADLFIGNDSGPRHIAIAFNKPVICIMGSTKPAYSVGPWEKGEVLRVDVDCGPCQKPVCTTDHRCMTQITAERVHQAAVRYLKP